MTLTKSAGASVLVDLRPMTNKVRLVCNFPSGSGQYELSVFCKPHRVTEGTDNAGGTLVLRYEISVANDCVDDGTTCMRPSTLLRTSGALRLL